MHKKILFLFLFLFLSLNLVSAVKPEPQIISNGCEIRLPQAIILEQNQNISFHTHVINTTAGANNFLTNDTTTCFVHLYNHSGHTLQKNMSWDLNGLEWKIDILGGNFSQIGEFVFYIQCQAPDVICADAGTFKVTTIGVELTQAENNLFMGGLILLIIFLVGSLICIYKVEHYIAKFVFYWVSHLLIILIFFSAWQFTNSYAIGYVGLAGIFKVFFYFFIIAVFPMVLVSIAWIVYIHAFNDHFQKLLDKGEDPETAFAMTKKKRRRW